MNIVEPYMRIVGAPRDRAEGLELLRFCELAARISHRSEEDHDPERTEDFVAKVVMRRGDFSVVEHRVVTVEAVVDRGITHEIVRHRIGSYTQESTRFVNYARKMPASFVAPQFGKEGIAGGVFGRALEVAEGAYETLIHEGVSPQLARSVFPTCLASKIWITYNLRSWRHFFLMRTTREAHPQMRQVTVPLLEQFKQRIPVLYDDVEPNAAQAENMRRMR